MRAATGLTADILIPGQLYPFVPDPVRELLATTGRVCVAEESTGGGTWGAEVAARLQDELWTSLRAPIRLVHSAETIIPAAPHLERTVLVQPDLITTALTEVARWTTVRAADHSVPAGTRAPSAEPALPPRADPPAEAGEPVLLPTLNPNDDEAVLVAWLVDDGARVTVGTPIAEAETSKAINEIAAEHDGVLRIVRAAGQTCAFGSVIGYLTTAETATRLTTTSTDARGRPGPDAPEAGHAPTADAPDRAGQLQAAVAAAVTRSHREIPAAFATASCDLEPAYALLAQHGDASGVELPALLVKAVGTLSEQFPDCYGRSDGGVFHRATEPDVAVTVDAGTGLFMPVIRRPGARDFDDVADDLIEVRTRALAAGFSDADFAGPAISVSLNLVEGITSVQPIILPPLVCIVSFAGVQKQLRLVDDRVHEARVITVGLTYDHRFINGSRATGYLAALRELLAEPATLLPDPH
jgi:pyruvate/2-oxoglutarate dehydrogenase complex dihydrolipoamide acyltransferase (E2) component